jgi:hypothetical protein
VYCGDWKPKEDNLRHEVGLSRFCFRYLHAEFARGPALDERLSDAHMAIKGHFYRIEFDCGTMNKTRWLRRAAKYRGCEDTVLVVVASRYKRSQERVRELMEWVGAELPEALFTTLDEAIADPFGRVFSAFGESRKFELDV